MAEAPLSELSDESLFVRIRGRIYMIPSAHLESYRVQKFEKIKGDQVDQILRNAPEVGEAVMINVVVVADADIQPPPYGARKARKGVKTGAKRSGSKKA
ncbi:hypothetical protein [Microvirga rosea]|uniref:hypothetical protein n=1 Tax=Microvirga rosea TaxID=2715425 RepID=UPI001D0AE7A7|nr:hypothetical protein [Microvirga rosea]MCB8819544.1 hypothetical protein [Microvirga rosea]